MVKGTVRIETRVTEGYEYGVYRITEEGYRYLMLAFDDEDEARTVGRELVRILEIPFKDHIYTEPKLEGFTHEKAPVREDTSVKPRRVMGVMELCMKLLVEKVPDDEIKSTLVGKYIDAGHTQQKAEKSASWILREVRKQYR